MEPAPGPEGDATPGIELQPPGPEEDATPGIELQPPGPEGDATPGIELQPPGPEGDATPGIELQPPGPEGDATPGIELQPPGPEEDATPGIELQPPGPEEDATPGIELQPPGPEGDATPGIELQPPGPEGDATPGIELQPPGPEEDATPGIELQPPGPEGDATPGFEPGERERLRVVFDMFDLAGEGLIRLEDFCQIASSYGADQVKELTKYLDPAGLGVIAFDDFCRGIAAIRNDGDCDSQNYDAGFGNEDDVLPCIDEFEDFTCFETNEVTDSAYMGSESTYSECETFTDEDTGTLVHHGAHEELETDSAIDATLNSEFTDTLEEPGSSVLFNGEMKTHQHSFSMSSNVSLSTEEHFEDYGESNEIDFASSSLCQDGDTSINGHFNRSSLLSPSPITRLSSKKVARHLQQTSAVSSDRMENLPMDTQGLIPSDLTDQVIFLEKRVIELEKDNTTNGEAHSRLRQEKLQLVHRVNALEEQLKEQETRSEQMLLEEMKKQKDALSKAEREQVIEIENLQTRLQQLDEENGELRACIPCLRANVERIEEEKQKLLDEVEDLAQKLKEEQESNQKLSDKLLHKQYQFQKEKEATQELIEDLRKQMEQLQLFKLEAERLRGRSNSVGLQEYNSRNREMELEHEIKRLKQDNRNLKEQNDELNGQIINLSIQGAKSLFTASIAESLAAEISSVSRDELMDAVQKQEEINYRLQDYIDRIVVAIMETNPAILEIKQAEANS
ncbi:rab11 family-interacting protein 3 isoform X2 [Heptranchias perlo]|uniref:rab11 family-interacting protein 3 isoform X2 n=1 Tax=Heptranchias perlo TaxID=212740 RepID=UPI003559DA17